MFCRKYKKEIEKLKEEISDKTYQLNKCNSLINQQKNEIQIKKDNYNRLEKHFMELKSILLNNEILSMLVESGNVETTIFCLNLLILEEKIIIPEKGHYETEKIPNGGHYETQQVEHCGSSCHETVVWYTSEEVWVDDYIEKEYFIQDSPCEAYYKNNSKLNFLLKLIDSKSSSYKLLIQNGINTSISEIQQMIKN